MLTFKYILVLLLVSTTLINAQAPETITFSGLFEITTFNATSGTSSESTDEVKSMATAFLLAIDDINNDPFILPDSTLIGTVHDTAKTTTGALAAFVTSVTEQDAAVVIGPTYSDQATICAVASGIYDVMILSPTASLSALSTKSLYPLFGRSVPPDTQQSQAMIDFLRYYYNITAEPKWLNCSIISTADSYGVDGSRQFIASGVAKAPNVTVLAYQQFLIGATDVSVEVAELQQSKTRVFIAYMYNIAFQTVLLEANKQKIIGDYFVWLCSDGCATDTIFQDANGRINKNYQKLSRGLTGFLPQGGTGIRYQEYLDRWLSLDPDQYIGAGSIPTVQSLLTYDTVYAAALSMHLSFSTGNYSVSGKQLFTSAGLVQFVGLTGFYDLTATGDRITDYEVVNVRPDYVFHQTFTWNTTTSLFPVSETFWHDGTTNIPDLDVRTPFDYWSCDDKESGTDSTGKTIKLEKVDGSDVNYIDADYECDQVIDCVNLSDEDTHCSPSLVAAYIACGIITGLMVFGLIALVPFIIIFGFIIRRGRIVLPGPLFLLIITLAGILGLISTYAWYGKAHTVACQFQLWLFGLACTALASAFFAKQIRIFREYEFPIAKVRKSQVWQKLKSFREVEFVLWFILCFLFPFLIFILWEAIATPIATKSQVNDEDHFVCNSGGVGRAGGVAFFFIFFGYLEALMIIGFIITFFTRKVPQPFMDKRLMTISIFNVIFVSAVIVGIYFVLYDVSPFAAWLIRTLAMMYLFFITPMIHMIPKLVGLIIIDRFKQNKGNKDQQGPTPKKGGKDYDPSLSQSNTQSMGL